VPPAGGGVYWLQGPLQPAVFEAARGTYWQHNKDEWQRTRRDDDHLGAGHAQGGASLVSPHGDTA
jgi:hypothetical protein